MHLGQLFGALGQRRVEGQHDVHVFEQRRRHRRLAQDGEQPHQLQRVQLEWPGLKLFSGIVRNHNTL